MRFFKRQASLHRLIGASYPYNLSLPSTKKVTYRSLGFFFTKYRSFEFYFNKEYFLFYFFSNPLFLKLFIFNNIVSHRDQHSQQKLQSYSTNIFLTNLILGTIGKDASNLFTNLVPSTLFTNIITKKILSHRASSFLTDDVVP